MKNFFEEFKKFISRGSVIDLAVGMIIGSSFTAIVSSLVNDILMPLIGKLIGGLNFSSLQISLGGESYINIGSFIQNVVNFVIVAFVLFLIVRSMNKLKDSMKKKEEEKPVEEVKESQEITLLKEINKNLIELKK